MTTVTKFSALSLSGTQRIAAGLAVIFVGLTLTWTAGIAQMPLAHNAAHDTRHAIGFPCH